MKPLRLPDNRVPVYYAGGSQISEFRGERGGADGPEDWVGSLSALPAALLPPGAPADTGVSRTTEGSLRALVRADPVGWLGPAVTEAFDGESGLLVKLLDAGERLPVHCHPTREFARTHLGSFFGKTEGWIVLRTRPGARVWLGLRERVTADDWRAWTAAQDSAALLAAMNELPVRPGEVLYVPAGLPHAIGPGVMVLELQEPTSFSILAEHEPFGVGAEAATLGLGWDLALSCFDLSGHAGRLAELTPGPTVLAASTGGRLVSLFAPRADTFFRAWLMESTEAVSLPAPSFAVVVVTAGAGRLEWDGGTLRVVRGDTVVVPYAAGRLRLRGSVSAIACLPPER